MSTPNLPIRYSIENDGTGAVGYLDHICSTVISEGGADETGTLRYASVGNTVVNANTVGTVYAIIGLRLKADYLDGEILLKELSLINTSSDDFEWTLRLNPDVVTGEAWVAQSNSAVEVATAVTGDPTPSVVTGGTVIGGGYVKSGNVTGSIQSPVNNAIRLGSSIDGTPDEVWLCVMPLSINADIYGGLTWRETV